MLKIYNPLILLLVFSIPLTACGGKRENNKDFQPYLENSRELQVPQWQDKNWYVQDWTAQKDGMEIIRGFYTADILHDQTDGNADIPVLVVGPNFYRLSGYDKRRVATTVDEVYGITVSKPNGSFYLKDWKTGKLIGVFDEEGLRLH